MMLLPMCLHIIMHMCMYFMFNAFYIMYMGLDFSFDSSSSVGSVLSIVGMREGDVTVWYQCSVVLFGLNGP